MKVIVPAAGFGSRLRPHTFLVPKTLLPVAGKPIIEYIINQENRCDISDLTIIHGHLGDRIREFLNGKYDLNIDFRLQERPLGLAHAIDLAITPEDKDLLIVLGDTIVDVDLKPVIERGITSIGVKEVADPRKFGVVVHDGKKVTKLVEKPVEPPSNLAIVGLYYIREARILKKAIRELIDKGITVKNEYQITDALQLMLNWGEPIETFQVDKWFDCGNPETLLATNKYLLQRYGDHRSEFKTNDSVIISPVYIGRNSQIERSVIGPYVSIGSGSRISNAIVQNSIVGDRAIIEKVLLSETLIGNRAEVVGFLNQINLGTSCWIKL